MAAIISIAGGPGGVSNDNLALGASCSLHSVDTATTYTWSLLSQPAGPNDLIVGSGRTVSFTPTKEGSYLVKLIVDIGLPSESASQLVAAVRELETGDRIPAIGETTENSANDGWANPVDAILERVTRFVDAGVLPGVAGAAGLAVGDVVYASGVATLAAGLPGERVVASWTKAQADSIAAMQGVYGVLVGSVNGGTIASGDVVTVRTTGLYQGVPYGSAPVVGDAVYISDAAGLALTSGTIERQIGTVCAVDTGATTYDVMVGPAPAELVPPDLFARTYFVSTSGSDVTGDGSIANPYATPQKAHDVALVAYPTDWVAVDIGPGAYVGDLAVEKWNIVFRGAGSRPETQATKLLGSVSVAPNAATQKFNEVVGLDRLYIENTTSVGDPSLAVGGTGAFSCIVTDCYITTGDATATCAVEINATNALRPRVTLNDCVVTVQAAGPDIVHIDKGDVRISGVQALFGSTVSSGASGKGITIANDATLFADRLLLDIQTVGPGIEVTGGYAGAKLTLSSSSVTLSYASCSHGISVTNTTPTQLAAFVWNTVFGVANGSSNAIYGSGSLGTNIVTAAQLSYLYGTSSSIGAAVTLLGMTGDVAGGDLSGNLPAPTVVKLQGRAVASTAPASGEVLGWNGTSWAPTTNSAPPSGAAGGVLGYAGSTYPNPNGLAPTVGSTIPLKGISTATTTFFVDSVTSASAAPGAALHAANNGGSGTGGLAYIAAGNSTSGDGGEVSVIGGDGSTAGGNAILRGGESDDSSGASVTASGAATTTSGGALFLNAGNGSSFGGDVTMVAGTGTAGIGGTVSMQGGSGPTGGNVALTGGAGESVAGTAQVVGGTNSGGDGGDVLIDGGVGSTVNGEVGVGIFDANAVLLGRSDKNVKTLGRAVGNAVTYAAVAATTIPVTSPVIILAPTAPRTMTATPTFQTSGIVAGTTLTVIGGTNAVTFQRESALAGSGLRLANPTQTLDLYDVMTLVFDGVYWRELSVSLNS